MKDEWCAYIWIQDLLHYLTAGFFLFLRQVAHVFIFVNSNCSFKVPRQVVRSRNKRNVPWSTSLERWCTTKKIIIGNSRKSLNCITEPGPNRPFNTFNNRVFFSRLTPLQLQISLRCRVRHGWDKAGNPIQTMAISDWWTYTVLNQKVSLPRTWPRPFEVAFGLSH